MHWNLMKKEEIVSIKLLKLKYGRGDQIIQTLCKIGSPKKWGLPSLICRNFKSLTKKIFWIIQSTWKSNKWRRIWVLKSFKIEIQKGDQIIHLFFRSVGSSQEIKLRRFKEFSFSAELVSYLIPGNWVQSWIWGNFRKL